MLRFILPFSLLYSISTLGQLYTDKDPTFWIVKKSDAVLKVLIITPGAGDNGGDLEDKGSGFFYNSSGEFLINHHVFRNFKKNSYIKVSDRHGITVPKLSLGSCLGNRKVDACKLKAHNYKVKEYFNFGKVEYLGKSSQIRGIRGGYIGHCKKDFNYVPVKANFIKESIRSKYINLGNEEMKDRDYLYNKDLLILEGRHCKGDSGAPFFDDRGNLIGMLINRFKWTEGLQKKYTFIGTPVNEIKKFIQEDSNFKPIRKSQIISPKNKEKRKNPYKL